MACTGGGLIGPLGWRVLPTEAQCNHGDWTISVQRSPAEWRSCRGPRGSTWNITTTTGERGQADATARRPSSSSPRWALHVPLLGLDLKSSQPTSHGGLTSGVTGTAPIGDQPGLVSLLLLTVGYRGGTWRTAMLSEACPQSHSKLTVSVHRDNKSPLMADASPVPPLWSPGFPVFMPCCHLSRRKLKSSSPVGGQRPGPGVNFRVSLCSQWKRWLSSRRSPGRSSILVTVFTPGQGRQGPGFTL